MTTADASGNIGKIVFSHNATAGSNVSPPVDLSKKFVVPPSSLEMSAKSAVDLSKKLVEPPLLEIDGGTTSFSDRSTCLGAELDRAQLFFGGSSSAGNAHIFVHDTSYVFFGNNSTAGNAFLGSTGTIEFYDSSSAGSAFVSGGYVSFFGASRGGTAQIELFREPIPMFVFGVLDISGHNAPGVTIGSLAGNEGTSVVLGANNLTVGTNNLSTTFPGMILDGGFGGVADKDWLRNAYPVGSQYLYRRHQCQPWRVAGGWLHYKQHICQSWWHSRR